MARVRDLIQNRKLHHVDESETVADAARRMTDLNVGAIPVMSGEILRGVFSERDLMQRVVVPKLDPETTPVRAVMSTELATIDELASTEQAMEAMHRCKCRHLPVTRGSDVVGFLSMRDLMGDELERKTDEISHMRAYIHGDA